MEIQIKKFAELNTSELYDILALRTNVFVVEQNCAYAELDYHDQYSLHIMGFEKNQLIAYARVVPPNTLYKEVSIGRIVVKEEFRNKGYAHQLFSQTLEIAKREFPNQPIKLQAQTYLEKFYKKYNFKTISDPYPDVGVWHVDMLYSE